MSKCGKGCMPECEYFVTCGCTSPFNCPYKIEENYQNSAFTTGNSNFLSGIEKWFKKLVEEGKIPQTPMNYDTASYKAYVAHLEAENAELKEKAQKLDEQLKAISDRTAKFPSLEQIEKRFLDWAIPFLKAKVTSCKEEWFGIDYIAKAIWEFIKNGFENAIAVDETNAALRERLDKAIELPVECYSKVWYLNIVPTISLKANTIYEGTLVGYHIVPINGMIYFIAEIRIENEYGVTQLPNAEKDYNKTWFTDRAAAEKRLAELGGEK